MRNKKIYSVIEGFTSTELLRCRKFILSPYFNKNEGIIQLFELIVQHNKLDPDEDWSDEIIWKKLNTQKPFNDIRLRKYFSDLLKLIERFIAQEEYESNPTHKANHLLQGITRRKLDKLNSSSIKTALKLSSDQKEESIDGFFYNYKIEQQINSLNRKYNVFQDYNLDKISFNLDTYFLIEKLRLYCQLLSLKTQKKTEDEFALVSSIIAHIESHDYSDIPQLAIYYQIFRSLKDQNEHEHYFKLRSLLEEHGGKFRKDEATDMYNFAINYTAHKINIGLKEFQLEYFILYKDLLNKRLIFENNELPSNHFFNVITIALRLKDFDWVEEFIESYKDSLNKKDRENIVTYTKAQLNFYKRDFSKVLELLRYVEYKDLSRKLSSKVMLINTYYELGEIEALISLLDSFRTYLGRNTQIKKDKKDRHLGLIKFLRKFIQIPSNEKDSIRKLKSKIEEADNFINKSWLLEKINQALTG